MMVFDRLLPVNKYNNPNTAVPLDKIEIAIHNTGDPAATAEDLLAYYNNVARGVFADNKNAWTSSNFIVGFDGTIIKCIEVGKMSYAVSGNNHKLINIEVCQEDKSGKFSDKAIAALRDLVTYLMSKYNIPADRVKRHYDYTRKPCPLYYVDNARWADLKQTITSAAKYRKITLYGGLSAADSARISTALKALLPDINTEITLSDK